ncbi:MAG: L-lactate dehydrogenase [Terracidiphilus sp.]|jgi:L-lactate dehydrogenase
MSKLPGKIGIVGAGSVGATIAYACMVRGVGKHISLFDVAKTKVEAEVLDLNHGLMFVPMAKVDGSDDLNVLERSDVIVVTAGAKQKPGQTRVELAETNTGICRKLIPDLLRVAPHATLLMVTNPVDVLTYVALKLSGLESRQVLGSGTVLDSSRFRFLIAQRCAVAVQNVHAYIAGEHGDSEIPLWSSASIGNVPVQGWHMPGHGVLSEQEEHEIFESVRTAAYKIIQGKGATNYAVGLAVAAILEAILWNEGRVLPVSSLLTDYRGISNVCLSVPSIVGLRGVEGLLPVPMNAFEEAGLRASAEAIQHVLHTLGF